MSEYSTAARVQGCSWIGDNQREHTEPRSHAWGRDVTYKAAITRRWWESSNSELLEVSSGIDTCRVSRRTWATGPRSDAWERDATLQGGDHQKMMGIIKLGASGSKIKHRCMPCFRKNMGNRTWAHGAIAAEYHYIKWKASSSTTT